MKIVEELPIHHPEVLELNRLAFGGNTECDLIESLRRDGDDVLASLAAIDGEHVVGHILFSPLEVSINGKNIAAAALAPMAVLPRLQKQGIGSALVWRGIQEMKSAGQAAIIVLGHTGFYPRFGFSHELAKNLSCDFNQFEAFMGLELTAGCLGGKSGRCIYPAAFGEPID